MAASELTPTGNPVIKFSVTDAEIAKLAETYADPKVPQGKAEYDELKASIKVVATVRIAIEKECKVQKAAALKHQRDVNAEGGRIVDALKEIEGPMKLCKAEVDDAEERALAAREEKEAARLETIRTRLARIVEYGQVSLNDSLEAVKKRLLRVDELDPNDHFDEFAKKAADARQDALDSLSAAVTQLEERERVAKEQGARQAELNRQAAEQAAAQKVIDDEYARFAKATQDDLDAKAAEERDRLKKLEDEATERTAKADIEAEAERQKALAPDKEKLRVFAQSLREIEPPVMSSDEGKMAIDRIIEQLTVVVSEVESEADRL